MAGDKGSAKRRALRRHAGPVGLMFASTTSMIGSGWLFGAFHAARIAGPFSLLSWVIGAAIILVLALCFAELAVIFPRSGALVHMSHSSHGAGLGRIWSWLLFLSYAPIPAVEAEAVVTYANNYLPYFIQPGSAGILSGVGFVASTGLLALLAVANLMTIRWLLTFNSTVTWWKILVPVATVIALMATAFHPENLHLAPRSYRISGIFTALPGAGIVFSFLGFRTSIELAGESRDPARFMPIAVIGSVMLTAIVYFGLQLAFLLALNPANVAHGWGQLSFAGDTGPFAGLAAALGLNWLAATLYFDAYVSPGGTGLIYVTGGSRVLMAAGTLQAGPRWLSRVSRFGVPWISVFIMWLTGSLFLLPFPAWQKMAGYVTAVTVLTFGLGPVTLLCLRRNAPHLKRPFRLRGAWFLAPLAFIASNWIIYWTGFETDRFLFLLLTLGFSVYAFYYHFLARMPAADFGWRQISWLLPWFGGMWALSWLGGLGGGLGVLSFGMEIAVIAVWSAVVLAIAILVSLTPEETNQAVEIILTQTDSE